MSGYGNIDNGRDWWAQGAQELLLPQQQQRQNYDQWWNQRRPRDDDWERFYLTNRNIRSIVILSDRRGRIYILVNGRLLEVFTDRGRIRIHRNRRGRIWILVREVELRDRQAIRDLQRQGDLSGLATQY